MGILRLAMGRELNLIDEKAYRFLWVTGFPLFEYDKNEKRFASLHHPFTSPVDEDSPLLDTDPGRVRARAYDVVLNGTEVGGGSVRIHDSGLQARIFKLLSLSDEEARERFGFFLDALQPRHPAPRRDRARSRPDRVHPLRRGLDPGCHRIPQDRQRHRPHVGVSLTGPRRAAAGAGRHGHEK